MIENEIELNRLLTAPPLAADRLFSERLCERIQKRRALERNVYIVASCLWMSGIFTGALLYFATLRHLFNNFMTMLSEMNSAELLPSVLTGMNPFLLLLIFLPALFIVISQAIE